MNGQDFKLSNERMTAVLSKGKQYIKPEFVSSDLTDGSYNIGLESKFGFIPWKLQDTVADTKDKELRERFNHLAETWERETEFVSSINDIILHPAHMQIIGMGPIAVPLILERMQQTSGLWFWALKYITDEDPVTEDIRGNLQKMRQAWLDWGQENEFYWYSQISEMFPSFREVQISYP